MTSLLQRVRRFLAPERKSAFATLADQYVRRLDQIWSVEKFPAIHRKGKIGILLTPWGGTAVPFYSIEIALGLRRRGCDAVLILDEENIFENANDPEERKLIANLSKLAGRFLPVMRPTSEEASFTNNKSATALREIVFENAVRREKSESKAEQLLENNPSIFERFHRQARRARKMFAADGITEVVLPGGIWGLSGAHAVASEDLSLTYWTYDSGPGQLTLGRNGVCAHFADYQEAYEEAMQCIKGNAQLTNHIVEETRRRLAIRRAGNDSFELQPKNSQKIAKKFDLVVLLNYRADTAAMARNLAFPNVSTWIRELVQWVRSRENVTLAIRQHPCERIPAFRSLENYDWIREADPEKIAFYASEESVNTYDLIDGARIVLPYTTRTGLEAALMERRVILGSRCYYACCPFIESAKTPGEYFAKLEAALSDSTLPSVTEEQAIAYFLAEHCLFANTVFTPIQKDFQEWCKIPLAEMDRMDVCVQLFSCIENNENFLSKRFQTVLAEQIGAVTSP